MTEPRPRTTSRALATVLLALCAAVGLTCSGGGEGREAAFTKVYDLGPLGENRDYYAPRLGVLPGKGDTAPPSPADEGDTLSKQSAKVADRLREAVPNELWGDGCAIEAQAGSIIVRAPQTVHDQIEGALKKMLSERDIVVSIRFQLVSVDEPRLASLPQALEREARMAGSEVRVEPRAVTPEEIDALLDLAGRGEAKVEALPSMTVFHGQVCHILVVNQVAIIADLKKSGGDGKAALEPVIGILNTGFTMQATATVAEDRKSVALELTAEWADVKKPIQRVQVEGLPLDVPEMSMRSAQTKVDAPCGTWMLAGSLQGRHWIEPRETMLWLVKAEVPDRE